MTSKTLYTINDEISLSNLNATRVTATVIGVFFGLFSGINHGLFRIIAGQHTHRWSHHQCNRGSTTILARRHRASIYHHPQFHDHRYRVHDRGLGNHRLVALVPARQTRAHRFPWDCFILSFLVGGGIGQVAFFIPAWAFATRMNKPLTWWRKVLPRSTWTFLSGLWIVTLVLATISILIGLEMAIFGFFPGLTDPEAIQDTALRFVLTSAILYVVTFIAGFGHELKRMEQTG